MGYEDEGGLGDLVVVDVGGATTDIHSVANGAPSRPNVVVKGIPDPYRKRTVEGDLGIRYNALSILEMAVGKSYLLYAVGLLAEFAPLGAIRIMKNQVLITECSSQPSHVSLHPMQPEQKSEVNDPGVGP